MILRYTMTVFLILSVLGIFVGLYRFIAVDGGNLFEPAIALCLAVGFACLENLFEGRPDDVH